MNRRTFITDSGLKIASSIVPEDYVLKAQINNGFQNDYVPFQTLVSATSSDKTIYMSSSGREVYEECVNPIIQKIEAMVPGDKSHRRKFIEPEQYITEIASGFAGAPVEALDKAFLPSVYGKNLELMKQQHLNFFNSHQININVQIEVSNIYVDAILMRFKTTVAGKDARVMIGVDYRGIEKYDASGMAAMFGGMSPLGNMMGGFGNLSGGLSDINDKLTRAFIPNVDKEPQPGLIGFIKGGGLAGKMIRDKAKKQAQAEENVPKQQTNSIDAGFGHGKKTDYIEWGAERVYGCLYFADVEEKAMNAFINFVSGFASDPELEARADQLIEQRFQQNYQQAAAYANMATQKQMQAAQLRQQVSQNIARNSAEISDGIMDSWNKKMASDSRISQNYSEAIRGVNTYQSASGSTFEFSNVADHVYETQYGDHVGISGNELDPELASKLNWTEVNKK